MAWAALIASLVFSAASFEMLYLYGTVHWQIMIPATMSGGHSPDAVFTVLSHLWCLQVAFAVLAVICAIWSFRGCPKWASVIALICAAAAVGTTLIIT